MFAATSAARMSGSRLRRTFSCLPAFLRSQPLTLMGRCPASVRLTAPCDFLLTLRSRLIARMTLVRWMVGTSNNPARRPGADTLHFSPFRRLRAYCRVLDRLFRRSPVPALKSDQPNWRPCDKLQILSWHTGPARGSDRESACFAPQRPMACDCRTGGVWLRHRQFPARELPRGHPASSRRAPQQGYLRVRHLLYPVSNSMCVALRDMGC